MVNIPSKRCVCLSGYPGAESRLHSAPCQLATVGLATPTLRAYAKETSKTIRDTLATATGMKWSVRLRGNSEYIEITAPADRLVDGEMTQEDRDRLAQAFNLPRVDATLILGTGSWPEFVGRLAGTPYFPTRWWVL